MTEPTRYATDDVLKAALLVMERLENLDRSLENPETGLYIEGTLELLNDGVVLGHVTWVDDFWRFSPSEPHEPVPVPEEVVFDPDTSVALQNALVRLADSYGALGVLKTIAGLYPTAMGVYLAGESAAKPQRGAGITVVLDNSKSDRISEPGGGKP
jgi:hypothetical protein